MNVILHFTREEFLDRQRKCREKLAERGLDGLLMFKQESMYYLTGYDTTGYLYFQSLYLGVDGPLTLVTRSGDLASARQTSIIEDIRIWVDRGGAAPAIEIRKMLVGHGLAGKRIGIEHQAVGLNAARGKALDAALEDLCVCVDASDLVDELRRVKSPAELRYVGQAAALAEDALEIANRKSVPGAPLGEVRAAMLAAVVAGGGDPPTVRWPMGCGESAQIVRYFTGSNDQRIGAQDQITIEFGVSYRHYHAALMHVVVTGRVDPRHRSMFSACRDALDACREVARPGKTYGDIYSAHAEALTKAGYAGKFLNTCGYGLGATYPPTWVEPPILYRDNPVEVAPGMVLFIHMILQDPDTALTMSLGETILVTEGAAEQLTRAPAELVVN